MLITNFAAGELSETLFGRTDLPQYYQGVSFLENFEVIPTGGIERRNGMKRALKMTGEGRLIPFIISREESFLLYLIPQVGSTKARIQIYRNGVKQGNDLVDSTSVPLPRTMTEIEEVQYAQNYNMMILVHENYAPLRVGVTKGSSGYSISVSKFPVDIKVELSYSEEMTATELKPYDKSDETYSLTGYLRQPDQYPRSVTFFGGRVIFGGTVGNPQRIFASRVNDPYNFSTHKIFLTKQRNYVAVVGKVTADPYVMELASRQDVAKLDENLTDYIPNSPILDGAKIVALRGFNLILDKPIDLSDSLTDAQRKQLEAMVTNYDNYNNSVRDPGSSYYERLNIANREMPSHPEAISWEYEYNICIGASYCAFLVKFTSDNSEEWVPEKWDIQLENDAARYATVNYLIGLIRERLTNSDFPYMVGPHLLNINEEALLIAAQHWRNKLASTMQYDFKDSTHHEFYYDTPDRILALLEQRYGSLDKDIYLSFYTETVLSEEYPTPDDGFTFEIASDMSDAIRWIGQNKNILVGTETAEWVIPAGITAVNVQAILNSRYGSDRIQGTSVGDAMCFFQSGRKALVEYYIPQQDNNFRANNMAMLSKNMLHEAAAFDFDFISSPYTKLFISREDGIIVALLYERSTGTFAWGRIRTGGHIESVATVPGPSGYDDVYLIVERAGEYFLEMLAERRRSGDSPDAEVFLDSYQSWTGNPSTYTASAVVYDETDNKTYPLTQGPIAGHTMWVGYPYVSRVRSMPVLANDRMKQNIIKNLYVRFNNSFMPKVRSVSMEEGAERPGNTDTIGRKEPYSGIVQIPFPGVWDRDVFFELIHDKPTRCRVLAVNAEAN